MHQAGRSKQNRTIKKTNKALLGKVYVVYFDKQMGASYGFYFFNFLTSFSVSNRESAKDKEKMHEKVYEHLCVTN